VCDYLFAHPGATRIAGDGHTYVYSEEYRRFAVGLAAPGQPGEGMSSAELAGHCAVPPELFEEWIRTQQ
jgi:hypothetical protein